MSGSNLRLVATFLVIAAVHNALGQETYQVRTNHPRLLIQDTREMSRNCQAALAEDYRVVKQRADAAVQRGGIESLANGWVIPEDLMNCGLA